MEKEIVDPANEYLKICKYEFCKEEFKADHMLQSYCPEKNGIKNYCKNRQKRINDQKNKESKKEQKNQDEVLETKTIVEQGQINEPTDPIMESYKKKAEQRDRTIKFIISRLQAYRFLDIPIKTFEEYGIDLSGFDYRHYLNKEKRYMLVFANFGIVWINDDILRIINLT